MDTVVVYKASPESLNFIINVLRKEGFNPITLDDPSPIVRGRAAGTYLVSIAVPREQAAGASSVLRKWDQSRQSEVSQKSKSLVKPFWYSTFLVVILAAIFLFLGILSEMTALLFILWLVVFALLANLDKIVQKFSKKDK